MSHAVHSPPPDESTGGPGHLGRVICWLGYWLLLAVATHYPKPPSLTPSVPGLDKAGHLITFALLAVLGTWAWVLASKTPRTRRWLAWAAILVIYAAADEVLQPLTGREADLWDWAANMVGCGLGLVAGWAWGRRR